MEGSVATRQILLDVSLRCLYHHFIDKETKVQAAQIIQVFKSRISESKPSALCMDKVKNFLSEKTNEVF